ncbi:unnamed protein product, partial [Timema podura]|nr:unnamed protein product [Timema podura]
AVVVNATLLSDLNRNLSSLGPEMLQLQRSTRKDQVPSLWKNISEFYLAGSLPITVERSKAFIELYTDRSFVFASHQTNLLHAQAGHAPLYTYHFAYRGLHSYSTIFTYGNPTDFGPYIARCARLRAWLRSEDTDSREVFLPQVLATRLRPYMASGFHLEKCTDLYKVSD